jgi:hypothetical protein
MTGMVHHDPVLYPRPRRGDADAIVFDHGSSLHDLVRAIERVALGMGVVTGPIRFAGGYVSEPRVRLFHVKALATRGWDMDVCVSEDDAGAQLGFCLFRIGAQYSAQPMGCALKLLLLTICGAVIAWFVKCVRNRRMGLSAKHP